MLYEVGKKIFKTSIDILKFIQVSLVFLSFSIVFYWLLELAGATFIQPAAPFFNQIKDIVHTFYTRTTTIDQITMDFSFLLATFILLFIAWGIKPIVKFIRKIEKQYDESHRFLKQQSEKIFNVGLEQEYVMTETRNDKFLVMIKLCATNLSKDKFFDKDFKEGVEEKEKEVLEEFYNCIEQDKCSKEILDDILILYFDNFNNIDKTINYVDNLISVFKTKYLAQNWKFDILIAIDAYTMKKEPEKIIKKMILLLRLNLINKMLCLGTFKQRYSLINNPKYNLQGFGIYKIFENEEVFCIKKV
ncbi:MAG: hypothetical protein PHC64_03760 [Candidatus Gastranaerophilales bacterium]|nr:hypothetical protein [Candidatus Gastranaerophilales bacterium]